MLKVFDGETMEGNYLEEWFLVVEKLTLWILYDKKGMLKSYEFMGGI